MLLFKFLIFLGNNISSVNNCETEIGERRKKRGELYVSKILILVYVQIEILSGKDKYFITILNNFQTLFLLFKKKRQLSIKLPLLISVNPFYLSQAGNRPGVKGAPYLSSSFSKFTMSTSRIALTLL